MSQMCEQAEMVGNSVYLKGYSADLRAERAQPGAEPGTFEPGVSGDQDFSVFVGVIEHGCYFQYFVHGAFPFSQSELSRVYSRGLSMHCQKPS